VSERSVIAATRRAYKELVDGTLRVQLDIDPMFKADFLRLFPEIDMPVALAPLRIEDAPIAQQVERAPRKGEVGGSSPSRGTNWKELGPLAQSAILVCKEPDFCMFVAHKREEAFAGVDEEAAASYIKERCGVSTRKELDTVDGARSRYGALMAEYREWRA
jgi:hypothetical protein